MRRSDRWTPCWGLLLFSSSAAAVLLLLGLGSPSSSLVEATAATSSSTGTYRRAVRKTTKTRQHQQRNLQSGKGGKGGSSDKGKGSGANISNNAGLPSGMLATIGAIDAMNHGILQHQNNAKKSSKGSSGGGLYVSDNINYGDGGSTPTTTTDPVVTNPTTGTIIQPNQGGSTEEIVSGNVEAGTNAAGSDAAASTEASSPLDTILDSVVSVVSGGGGNAHGATQDSDADTDGAVEMTKDDVDGTEEQDSASTPTTPTVTVPSTGAEQDSISTGTPSTPIDTSEGPVIVGDSTENLPTDSSTNPSAIPPTTTTTNPSTGTIVDDSTGIDGPQAPTNPSVLPTTNSGTTDESFFDGSTTAPDNQQEVPQEKDEEHISTDQLVYLDDEGGDNSDPSGDADGEGDNGVVIIMPTPGHDDTSMNDETSAGLPEFEYGSTINIYSPNQPGKGDNEETEDDLIIDSIAVVDTVEEFSEESDDDKKGKDKHKPADDEKESNVDLDAEDEDKPADDEEESNVDLDAEDEDKPADDEEESNVDLDAEDEDKQADDEEESNVDPDAEDEDKRADDEEEFNVDDESATPADIQVSDVDPNSEASGPSTLGDDEESNLQPNVNDNSGNQDSSPSTETDPDLSPEEAADGNVITIPPLDQDESVPSDTESEISNPTTDKNIPEHEALSPAGDDNDESGGDDGESRRLDMPEGLVVSVFLSEEENRRLQTSPTDPLKNQQEFELILNGMGETEITLQNDLARHLNGYLLERISDLSFVSIDRIAAFLTTKSYQGRPKPAIVVKSIEGAATYRGVEKPSPRILEANTLGAFNTGEGRTAFVDNLRDSDDDILSRTIDVRAEINRGAITPSSDTTSPIANAATQNDTKLRANSGSAARLSGIAIGGLIIIVAMFVVGNKLVRRPKDKIELEDENSLEHKYDLDSIESETALSSTLVSYHGGNSSGEKDTSSHHRDIMAYDDSTSYPEGTLVLSPVAESRIAEEMIDDLVIAKKIEIVMEEPQKEEKIPSPLLHKLYSFGPSSLKRAILDNGLQKDMAATSILQPGRSAYDMSIISPSTSDNTNESPQEQSPGSDCGKSVLLLEDGLASRGPDPPTVADLAVMVYSHSESTSEEDETVPSTIDVDAVDSNEAARRLGLGIRSFSDVKEEDEENRLVVKSSPKPVATPERKARPSTAKASADSEEQQQNIWRQQKSQSSIPYVPRAPMTSNNNTPNKKGPENKLYDPIFVNGKVQMKERSPPTTYRQVFRK